MYVHVHMSIQVYFASFIVICAKYILCHIAHYVAQPSEQTDSLADRRTDTRIVVTSRLTKGDTSIEQVTLHTHTHISTCMLV